MVNPYRAGDGAGSGCSASRAIATGRRWPGRVDHPEWIDEEPFATGRGRRHHAAEVVAAMDAVFATRPRAEWFERFDAEGVWFAPVNSPAEVLEDPQAIAAGAFVDVPGGLGAGPHRAVASPVDFAGVPRRRSAPVPALGEHTAEVLAELGL